MNVILECNQNNADKVFKNGNYVSSWPTVPFYTGDTLIAKLCSIDSQKSDSNTIVVDEEILGSITFSYYDCDYDALTSKTQYTGGAWPALTAQYYAGYAETQILELLTAQVLIPWQQYTGTFSVKLWMSWIDQNGNTITPTEATCTGIAFYNPPYQTDTFITALPRFYLVPIFREGSLQLVKLELNTPDGTILYDSKWYNPAANTYTPRGPPTIQLALQKVNFIVPAGRYDPSEIAQLITQQISSPNGVKPVYVGGNQIYTPNNNCLLCIQDPLGSNFIWAPITNAAPTFDTTCYRYTAGLYRFFGADLVAMQYGENGSIFQFSYLHTPIYNSASPNTKNAAILVIGTQAGGNIRYNLITAATGLTVHSLDPPDFWTNIGLINPTQPASNQPVTTELLSIVGGPNDGVKYYTFNSWNATSEGSSLNFFTPSYNRQPTTPPEGVITYYETDAIPPFALLGNEINSNPDGGYLLVKGALNAGTTEYYDNLHLYDNILAGVSTQYNTANSITGFEDSSIPFTNTGAPFMLSSITIDILDARTKTTAPQLGPNNTVLLQIVRAPQQVNIIDGSGKPVQVQSLLDS